MFLGLGAVALLVGAVGVANMMVISVLERTTEIGLRRAVGAARRHVAVEFFAESLLLGAVGGATGALLGAAATYTLALQRGWQPPIPASAVGLGMVAACTVGAVAGLYPALRAPHLTPTDALRTTSPARARRVGETAKAERFNLSLSSGRRECRAGRSRGAGRCAGIWSRAER